MNKDIVEKELSYKIMNAAYQVNNQLGPGFLESIYEAAMALELKARGHNVETQVRVPVYYREEKIGEHILDVFVDDRVILELKAVAEIAPIHLQQALSYLKATGLALAIVINFGSSRVEYKRVVNTINKKEFA
jgi:GxxExxY protein